MGQRWHLRDADITKLLLCKEGANRHRVFLLKSDDDGADKPVARLAPIFKEQKQDWRTAYVPVAVPGAEENQGLFPTGDGDVDVWESEEEIAKAAHSFMVNGRALGADQHFDGKLANGVQLVESAQALADFEVNGHKIAKGTWYVGLQFDDAELRQKVDAGEIDAVSVEGLAHRALAKVETFSKPGTADVTPADRKKITPLAEHYLKLPHPFTSCVRDQEKHGVPPDHAKRRCAVLLDTFDPARLRHSRSIAKDGETSEDAPWSADAVQVIDALPEPSGSLEDVEQPPDGFWNRVAKALGIALDEDPGTVEDVEIGERVEQLEGRFDGLEKKLIGTDDEPGLVAKIATSVEALAKETPETPPPGDGGKGGDGGTDAGDGGDAGTGNGATPDGDKDSVAKVNEAIEKVAEEFAGKMEPLAKRLDELEAGQSTQQEVDGEGKPVAKSGSDLAGILF